MSSLIPLPRHLRRLLALELLFGRRAISLSAHSVRLLSDLLAWLYKPVQLRRRRLYFLPSQPLRAYQAISLAAISVMWARWLHKWLKRPRAKMRGLKLAMDAAASYEEWHRAAEALEALENRQIKSNFNTMYDVDLIKGRYVLFHPV